jgi:hypothetical protein
MGVFLSWRGEILAAINEDRIHINVQIEGTTDSSFLSSLGNIYGEDRVLVYKVSAKRFIRLSDLDQTPIFLKVTKELLGGSSLFNQNNDDSSQEPVEEKQLFPRKNLPPETLAVCGYFTPSFFKGIIDNPFISIILKDPLERMIALYQEWQEQKGDVDWRVKIPYDRNMDFHDFVLKEDQSNFQSKCLGSRRLGDFDLVGLAECQTGFIAQLKNQKWTGYIDKSPEDYPLDKPRYRNLGITPEFLAEFKEMNQMDYSIFQLAREFIGYC